MGWEHYQTVDPLQKEPQVRRGLFGQPRSQDLYSGLGVKVLRTRLLFQIHQIFNVSYFLNYYHLRKKYLFHKMPKNHPKIYAKPQNIGKCSKWRDLALLET